MCFFIETECEWVLPIKSVFSFSDETHQRNEEEEERNEEVMCERAAHVSRWHEMLRPILTECEKRSHFDIHALGTDIMDMLPEENQQQPQQPNQISFTDIMNQRDQTYTARYFLSLLLLTNNKNVYLNVKHPEQNGDVLCSKDDITIKMRSRTRHHDEVNKMDKHLEESTIRVQPSSESTQVFNRQLDEMNLPGSSNIVKVKKLAQKRKWNKT